MTRNKIRQLELLAGAPPSQKRRKGIAGGKSKRLFEAERESMAIEVTPGTGQPIDPAVQPAHYKTSVRKLRLYGSRSSPECRRACSIRRLRTVLERTRLWIRRQGVRKSHASLTPLIILSAIPRP